MTTLLSSAGALLLLFTAAWLLARRVDNYSIVDGVWALSFTPVALFYAATATGLPARKWLLAALIAAWSLRLGVHLVRRIAAHHPGEDRRYAILRKKWQPVTFLFFFLAQGLLTWLLMLPVFLICRHASPSIFPLEIIGAVLWVIALTGEGVADAQLSAFIEKRSAATGGEESGPPANAVCREGLWKYSRHPNYFFQSLIWWGLFLMALPAPHGAWSVIAPLAMLTALLRFTGIPLTEKLSLEKRGDAYRAYQKTTSPFIPLPPKTLTPDS